MRRAREALAIRRAVLPHLLSHSGTKAEGARNRAPHWPPHASLEAWRLFLEVERCAAPLLDQLMKEDLDALAPGAASLLRDEAAAQLQRVLSVRAQLDGVGRLVEGLGLEVVVLKGGVPLALDEPPIPLADLDLLVRREEIPALEEALRGAGYGGTSFAGSTRHLPHRVLEGHVALEIHHSLLRSGGPPAEGLWRGTRPVPGHPGLRVLGPPDHLWNVLVHSVSDHLNRRGRIRDLLLVRRAAEGLEPEERDEVYARMADHPFRRALAAQLAQAEGRREGDPFRAEAAAFYLVADLLPILPDPRGTSAYLSNAAIARLAGPAEWQVLREESDRLPDSPSGHPWVRMFDRLPGPLGPAWRRALRHARLALVRLLARPLARWARKAAEAQAAPPPPVVPSPAPPPGSSPSPGRNGLGG